MNNVLKKSIKSFSKNDLKNYNKHYHSKIRDITRFTFKETINARDYLVKNKLLKIVKFKTNEILIEKNYLIIKGWDNNYRKKNFKMDIVVNVSGPLNVKDAQEESPLIQCLKKINLPYDRNGFIVNSNFESMYNIFVPGSLANSYNPERLTILNAVIKNSKKVGKFWSYKI